MRRANAALETYTLSGEGWRHGPSETLRQVLADLMRWCADTQRDFDAALDEARARYATQNPPLTEPRTHPRSRPGS
ncbi:hypothetical protein [Streptomyces palmae]|uniref:hypothetical protein n=1 Tax=Streptomyces palmae TaxID=1701085 RepID=UPI001FD805B5|nr:hypothetical protein [Streptomyces palmae]